MANAREVRDAPLEWRRRRLDPHLREEAGNLRDRRRGGRIAGKGLRALRNDASGGGHPVHHVQPSQASADVHDDVELGPGRECQRVLAIDVCSRLRIEQTDGAQALLIVRSQLPGELRPGRRHAEQVGLTEQRIAVGKEAEGVQLRRIAQQRRLDVNQPGICGVTPRGDARGLLTGRQVHRGELQPCPAVQLLAERDHVLTLTRQQVIEHPVSPIEHLRRALRGSVEGARDRIVRIANELGPLFSWSELSQQARHTRQVERGPREVRGIFARVT